MGKYEDYLKLAESDLKSSELILNSSNDELMQNIAAYHAQQAVEKIDQRRSQSHRQIHLSAIADDTVPIEGLIIILKETFFAGKGPCPVENFNFSLKKPV